MSDTTHILPAVNGSRLLDRLFALAEVGAIDGGGCARLALTDDDKAGRDLVVSWMQDCGLEITIDAIGNVIGVWNVGTGAPVMSGSHIDTVRTGGKYDGNLGVLAALEAIQTCQDLGIVPERPLAVGFFTDEEGSRFPPDMLGSLVYVGGMPVEEAHDIVGIDGVTVGHELQRIGYLGSVPCPGKIPHAFIELHIEQGPVLEQNGVTIGAVTGVQGISWIEVAIDGQSNHAGTTPMSMRHDPSYVAAEITVFLRELSRRFGGHQVCTVGKVDLFPNLVNVVPARATLTLDVRNTEENILKKAESEIHDFLRRMETEEGVTITTRVLARFEPVLFDDTVITAVHDTAEALQLTCQVMPSGAGHDAQMFARVCPSGMIFVPSHKGISHNPAEHTEESDLIDGANVLLHVMLKLAGRDTHS